MSAEYTRHAYARTIIAELQRHLIDTFMETTDAPPKRSLVCEEVFYADRDVPQGSLHDVLELLQQLEAQERQQMREYHMERRAPLPTIRPEQPREQPKKRKQPGGKRTAGAHENRGSGGSDS